MHISEICELIKEENFNKSRMLNFILGYLRSTTQYNESLSTEDIENMIEKSYNFANENRN